MTKDEVWQILEIPADSGEDAVRKAYRKKVVLVNPEDDLEGFMQLREAYETALRLIREPSDPGNSMGEAEDAPVETSPIQAKIQEAIRMYDDLFTRRDLEKWEKWFSDPICTDLDTIVEIREQFLVMTMERFFLPHAVWELADRTFDITREMENLAEKFPQDYLTFLQNQMQDPDDFNWNAFTTRKDYQETAGADAGEVFPDGDSGFQQGDFESPADAYLRELTGLLPNLKQAEDDLSFHEEKDPQLLEEGRRILQLTADRLNFMQQQPVFHPVEFAGRIRLHELRHETADALRLSEKVLSGKVLPVADPETEALAIYEILSQSLQNNEPLEEEKLTELADRNQRLLSETPDTSYSRLNQSAFLFWEGKTEEAEEACREIFNRQPQAPEALKLFSAMNQIQLKREQEHLSALDSSNSAVAEERNQLSLDIAWRIYRVQGSEPALQVLSQVQETPENALSVHDLYARNFFNLEQYEEALPHLEKWYGEVQKLKERTAGLVDEKISAEDRRNLSNEAFCLLLMGTAYRKTGQNEKALSYFRKSLELERQKEYPDFSQLMQEILNTGTLLSEMNRTGEALNFWNEILKDYQALPFYMERQKAADKAGDYETVLEDFKVIHSQNPRYVLSYYLAAKAFDKYGLFDSCDQVLKAAEEAGIHSDALDYIRMRRGIRQDAEGRKDAKAKLEQLASAAEKGDSDLTGEALTNLYVDLAFASFMNAKDLSEDDVEKEVMQKEIQEGLDAVRKGKDQDPEDLKVWMVETDLREFNGEDVSPVYEEMERRFPRQPSVPYEYGEYLSRQHRSSEALKQYLTSWQMNPSQTGTGVCDRISQIYLDLYNNFERPEDFETSVEFAERQMKADDDPYYCVNQSLMLQEGYRLTEALKAAKDALEQDPENPYAMNAAGCACILLGQYGEAEKYLKSGIEKAPNGKFLYENLMRLYEKERKYPDALAVAEDLRVKFGYTISLERRIAVAYMKSGSPAEALKRYGELDGFLTDKLEESGKAGIPDPSLEMTWLENLTDLIKTAKYAGDKRAAAGERRLKKYLNTKNFAEDPVHDYKLLNQIADEYLYTFFDYREGLRLMTQVLRLMDQAVQAGNAPDFDTRKSVLIHMAECYGNLGQWEMASQAASDAEKMISRYVHQNTADRNAAFGEAAGTLGTVTDPVQTYLSYSKYRPIRLGTLARIRFFQGRKEEAHRLAEEMLKSTHCDFCRNSACSDGYEYLAKIFRWEGNREMALKYFRLSAEAGPDDMEIALILQNYGGQA